MESGHEGDWQHNHFPEAFITLEFISSIWVLTKHAHPQYRSMHMTELRRLTQIIPAYSNCNIKRRSDNWWVRCSKATSPESLEEGSRRWLKGRRHLSPSLTLESNCQSPHDGQRELTTPPDLHMCVMTHAHPHIHTHGQTLINKWCKNIQMRERWKCP